MFVNVHSRRKTYVNAAKSYQSGFRPLNEGAVKSATRVLDLLELFSSTTNAMGVSDISKRLGFPKSSTYMLLTTLEGRGFIVSDEARRFRLHPKFSAEARASIGGTRAKLVHAAGTPIKFLVEVINETCFLTVMRSDWMAEYVAKVSSLQELRLDAPVGTIRELNAGSGGMMLLAHLPQGEFERFLKEHPLQATTPKSIVDPARLRQELATIRTRGYALSEGANYPQASGVSAPIRGPHGNVVAAVSIGAPTSRLKRIRARVIDEVLRCAEAVSRNLDSVH